jgi:hypothetical protein
MAWQPVRFALLLGAITAVTVSPARADNCASCCTTPCTRTIQVKECVPETYKVKRTVYKTECKTEEVDSIRCEKVSEVRERTVCVTKKVPVVKEEVRKVCKTVNVCEDKTVMKTCYKNVQETVMKKTLVRAGHWECETVCKTNYMAVLHNHFNKCCDPCTPCCKQPETTTSTHKKWVSCPEYKECPVTVCKKVCEQVPTTVKVNVCQKVWSEVTVKVCSFQCVTENRVEKYTVCVTKQVPCKVTRTVRVCVPHEEEVTLTRMVSRCVTREVPATNCCNSCNSTSSNGCDSCNSGCDSCGSNSKKPGLLARFHKNNDCGSCR